MIYTNTKNVNESSYAGSFASLILECQENDMRIFNAILESDYEEAVRINEGTLLEGEKAQRAWKTVKDVAAVIIDALKRFGQKLKQLYDAAVAKLKEVHTKKIAKFATDFEKEFDASKYDDKKILGKDEVPLMADDISIVEDIDIATLLKSSDSDVKTISNRVANPDHTKELISNAFKSSKTNVVKYMIEEYKNEKFITPSMFSKYISKFNKNSYASKDKTKASIKKENMYSASNISATVSSICKKLKDSNSYITKINDARKTSFKQLDDVVKKVKESEKSIDRTRACLEYSSAYQTVIATIANVNIKIVMMDLKNNIRCLNLIKSACSKDGKKEDNSKGEEAAAATNEAFSMIF